MKTNSNSPQNSTKPQAQQGKKSNRPENKDNLDSREGEEQNTKGGDVTHNKKEKQSEAKKNA